MTDWRPHLLFWHRNSSFRVATKLPWKIRIQMNLPRLRNFGCFNLPSNTSQYGDTNARKIKINATTVKLTAIRKFLLCTPILLQSNDDSYWMDGVLFSNQRYSHAYMRSPFLAHNHSTVLHSRAYVWWKRRHTYSVCERDHRMECECVVVRIRHTEWSHTLDTRIPFWTRII